MSRAQRRRAAVKVLTIAAILVGVFVLARFTEVQGHLGMVRAWIHEAGSWGYVGFALGYAVATVLGVPGTPLTVLAGLLFGFWPGLLVMIGGTTLAAAGGFFAARKLMRGSLERWLCDKELYQRLAAMIEREGWVAIPLARVLPVFPFPFVNYTFGLSRVPFWTYLLASELVMIPMNAVWVGVADGVYVTISNGGVPWVTLGWVTGFGLAIVIITWVIKRLATAFEAEAHHEPT